MEENKNNSIINLVNPEFDFGFNGKIYHLRKATLDKAVQYQGKIKELTNDAGGDSKLLAYCIWLMLKDQDPALTEEFVLNNTPADSSVIDILSVLGFINPSKLDQANKIKETVIKKLTGEASL